MAAVRPFGTACDQITDARAPDRATQTEWFMVPRPAPGALAHLYCFPYAGGWPQAFRSWAGPLAPEIELVALALPGRAARMSEPLSTEVAPLASTVAAQLAGRVDRPFALFGHSFGALLAFEVARQLVRVAAPLPAALIVSACPAPHVPSHGVPAHTLSDERLIAKLHELDGTPPAVLASAELLEALLPAIRADLAAYETHSHRPGPPLPVPIVAFAADRDRLVEPRAVAEWSQHTCEPFELRRFGGDHMFVHAREREVLAALAESLRTLVPVPGGWPR